MDHSIDFKLPQEEQSDIRSTTISKLITITSSKYQDGSAKINNRIND